MQKPAKAMPSEPLKEKFINILVYQNTNEIIPFVKSLSDADKKTLTPLIKEKIGYYQEYAWNGQRSERRGTETHYTILSIAAFVCLNEKDYKRNTIDISYLSSGFIKFHETWQKELMEQISVDDILEWYQPEWMSRFINDPRTNRELRQFTYQEIVRWYRKGYITLSPELVVAALPKILFDLDWFARKYDFHPERLLADPLTLEEHIWYFFTYPSDIYMFTNSVSGKPKSGEPLSWTTALLNFCAEGRIDRMRLLRETLLATTRNFNKLHTNWFVDMFIGLKPSADELLNLQDELFASLASAQTKPVSTSLACIKSICTDKAFCVDDFLGCFPALFGLTTKAILGAAIDIAAEMIKADASLAPVICADLCNGFASKDESIQKKIAKMLVKYADAASIHDPLAMYAEQILMSVRPLLKDFLESADGTPTADEAADSAALPDALPVEDILFISDSNRIHTVETFEDFLFFLAQAFDNNEPWHTYYVPVYIQQFDREITAERVAQLEPTFKQAYKLTTGWSVERGFTDYTTASFFISYARHLISKYPGSSAYIAETLATGKCLQLSNWQKSFTDRMEIHPWYSILRHALDAVVDGRDARLLSTPTHTPLWIDPVVLVRRLANAQGRGEVPHTFDMQLALHRCAPDHTGQALQLARTELKGELHNLMVFLFDPATAAPAQVEHPSWWMTAALCKHPQTIPEQTAAWGFDAIPTEYFTGKFEWSIGSDREGNPVFKSNPPVYDRPVKTLYSEYAYSIYRSRMLHPGDVTRLICSTPYNHDAFIANVLWYIDNFTTADSSLRPALINSLDSLLQLRLPFSPADYLLVALCFFAPDKTIKDYAASLWSESVTTGNLNVSVLGAEMGRLAFSGWLPLKRFTTVIESNMMNISARHNRALEELIVCFLAQLYVKPLMNLKKLLEIYSELLALNGSKGDTRRVSQLDEWGKVSNLKKVVDRIKN